VNRLAGIVASLVAATLGCAPTEVVESPLLDSDQPPIVLVERRELELPTTGPGNRFVSGWLFDKEAEESTIKPAGGSARLEVVQLRSRPRTLALSTVGDAVGPTVTAAIGSRRLEVRTTDSAVEILLPADLAHDRHLVDLEFAEPAVVRLSGAVVSAAAAAGFVRFRGDDVVHHPWSVVDFVRRVGAGVTLVGEFVPPAGAAPDQRFAVILDRGDGVFETVFEVRPAALAGEGPLPIRARLRTTAGLVRIRLLAEGDGPAGRWRGLRLSSRLPQPPTAFTTVPEPPRVVVVYVLDALRADVVGHLGADLGATPCMDGLAAEGAMFADHFSVAPNTGPATKSLFTGFGFLRGQAIPVGGPRTLAEDFAAAGYRTVSVSSNPHLSPSFGLTRGFDEVLFEPLDEAFDDGHASTVNDSAERVQQAALHWLDGVAAEDRVFLYLHTLNPHNPYTPPPPFPSRFLRTTGSKIDGGTKTLASIRDRKVEVSPADERRIREWYTAGLAYNDAALCGLMDGLRRRFDDRFLFVVTSDHGEELFDHGGVLHGYTLYDELLHVPLVVWWPERIRPTRIQTATDTLDLTATLRALIGSTHAAAAEDGEALWGLIDGGGGSLSTPALHFATAPGLRRAAMVRSERWKVIRAPRPRFGWGMGRGRGRTHDAEYVFNLVDDPSETSNLAGTADLEVDWLRLQLRAWTDAWQARQPATDDTLPNEETRRQLEALGYTD
jgi:arylsulfatase A-like enzyme